MRSREDRNGAEPKIEQFPGDLAVNGHVSASTQNQAFNALLFLHREILHRTLENIQAVRVPTALTPDEVGRVMGRCRARRSWWYFAVFPARDRSRDPRSVVTLTATGTRASLAVVSPSLAVVPSDWRSEVLRRSSGECPVGLRPARSHPEATHRPPGSQPVSTPKPP